MLTRLNIQNFQSHKLTNLRLSPNLNIIVGTSNCGKTAVIRALRWLVNNRPLGKSFIRKHSKRGCRVSVVTDGHAVARVRSDTENEYRVDDEKLEAVGSDVPGQVLSALPLSDINWSNQLDPCYLLLDPPGRIAEVVSDAVHLQSATSAASRLASWAREAARSATALQDRIAGLRPRLERLAPLERYKALLEAAEALEQAVAATSALVGRLRQSLGQAVAIEQQLKAITIPVNLPRLIDAARGLEAPISDLSRRSGRLRAILAGLEAADGELEARREADPHRLAGLGEAAGKLEREVRRLVVDASGLDDLLEKLGRADGLLKAEEKAKESWSTKYNGLLAELETCPTCGQALDGEAKQTVIERASR